MEDQRFVRWKRDLDVLADQHQPSQRAQMLTSRMEMISMKTRIPRRTAIWLIVVFVVVVVITAIIVAIFSSRSGDGSGGGGY